MLVCVCEHVLHRFHLIQGHLALLRLGWHLRVISSSAEMSITMKAESSIVVFLAQMTPRSQKRNMLMLPLPQKTTCALRLPLLRWMTCVTAPHRRMTHSSTLLLWWFLPSVYYIMQQRFCSVTFTTINTHLGRAQSAWQAKRFLAHLLNRSELHLWKDKTTK